MHHAVFQKIDELSEAYYRFWEDVCNLESPTAFKEGIDAVGRYFAEKATERGWLVEIFPQSVSGDVVAITMNANVNAAPLTLSGHIDTVHPVGSFGTPACHRDGERIYGPGTTDCKGGVVAGFLTMHALDLCGYRKRPVQLLIQTDEEVSSTQSQKSTIGYICEKAKNSVAFLNLETFAHKRACISRKGSVTFLFTVTGKAGHSSRCVTEGANAIVDACHKMIILDRLKDDDGITCNCSTVQGGTVDNSIPEVCAFKVNLRFATLEQWKWIESYMQEVASTVHVPGCSCTVQCLSFRTCMEKTEKNLHLLEKANRIFESVGLETLNPAMLRGGSDAADASTFGIPCLDSQGVRGNGSHTKNESAVLVSLGESAKRAAAIAYYLED